MPSVRVRAFIPWNLSPLEDASEKFLVLFSMVFSFFLFFSLYSTVHFSFSCPRWKTKRIQVSKSSRSLVTLTRKLLGQLAGCQNSPWNEIRRISRPSDHPDLFMFFVFVKSVTRLRRNRFNARNMVLPPTLTGINTW